MTNESTASRDPRTTPGTPWVRGTVFLGFMLFCSVSLNWYSPYIRPYALSLLGLFGALTASALLFRIDAWQALCERWLSAVDRMESRAIGLLIAAASLIPIATAAFVLDPIPHIPDGYAYLFQARLFTLGQLWADAPTHPEFFPAPWSLTLENRVFAVFPPGWPLLLALGVVAGATWLVNPVLGGLSLYTLHHLWRELFDRTRANRALALCLLSPFYLFMSASFMSHNASLLASALFVLGFLRGVRKNSLAWGAVAGLAIGFQILVRPVSAAFIWFPVVTWFALFRRSRAGWRITTCSIAGSGLGTMGYSVYNRLLVGEWGVPPLYYMTPANRYGFANDIGLPWASSFPTPGHDLWRAMLNFNFNAVVMNNDLFGWPMASLGFAVFCLLSGRLAWQHRLCASVILAFVVSYAGYWYNGVAFGARFYYCLLPYLAILTVEGARIASLLLPTRVPGFDRPRARTFVIGLVFFFSLYGTFVYTPRVALTDPYWNQRKISYELYEELEKFVQPGDLVLVETDSDERYNPVFDKNSIDIETSPIIYARDLGDAANAKLIQQFPERRVVRWRYPIERLDEERALVRIRKMLAGGAR